MCRHKLELVSAIESSMRDHYYILHTPMSIAGYTALPAQTVITLTDNYSASLAKILIKTQMRTPSKKIRLGLNISKYVHYP